MEESGLVMFRPLFTQGFFFFSPSLNELRWIKKGASIIVKLLSHVHVLSMVSPRGDLWLANIYSALLDRSVQLTPKFFFFFSIKYRFCIHAYLSLSRLNCIWHFRNWIPAPANCHTQLRTRWVIYTVIVCCFYLRNGKSSPRRGAPRDFLLSCCGWTTRASAPHRSGDTRSVRGVFSEHPKQRQTKTERHCGDFSRGRLVSSSSE